MAKFRIPALACICVVFSYIMGCHEYGPAPVDPAMHERGEVSAIILPAEFADNLTGVDGKQITGV